MAKRKIVHIDEEKCNGCGLCVPNCAEGAIQIIDGKARLVNDIYCDGLGACLGHCPQDAITIEEREAAEFDEKAVEEHLNKNKTQHEFNHQHRGGMHMHHGGGCPGSQMRHINRIEEQDDSNIKVSSRLRQWPVQLALVPPEAPYFKNADLLITATCVPFAYGNYHNDYLKDRAVAVGCPKLDDIEFYTEKLEEIIRVNDLESVTVLRMQVPCCGGIAMAVKEARDKSGVNIPIKVVTIGIEGNVIKKEYL